MNGGEPESTCNRYRSGVSARTANARFVADRRDRGRRAFAGARAPRGLPLFDRPPFDVEQHLEVLHNSGHSPGSIALWGEASGVLFSGDTVHDGLLVTDAWHSSIDDYVLSTERLLALPVRLRKSADINGASDRDRLT